MLERSLRFRCLTYLSLELSQCCLCFFLLAHTILFDFFTFIHESVSPQADPPFQFSKFLYSDEMQGKSTSQIMIDVSSAIALHKLNTLPSSFSTIRLLISTAETVPGELGDLFKLRVPSFLARSVIEI